MQEDLADIRVLENRKEEQVLEEVESRLREEAAAQGLETKEGKDSGFQISRRSADEINSEQDLKAYLSDSSGNQAADVVLYVNGRGRRGASELAEPVDVRLQFDNEIFLNAYSALQEEVDVRTAGFNMTGYGEGSVEAYNNAIPMVTFLLGNGEMDMGATVSYRDGGTVETMWSEGDEGLKDLFYALKGEGLEYEGAALEGEEESEWLIADYGSRDPDEMR